MERIDVVLHESLRALGERAFDQSLRCEVAPMDDGPLAALVRTGAPALVLPAAEGDPRPLQLMLGALRERAPQLHVIVVGRGPLEPLATPLEGRRVALLDATAADCHQRLADDVRCASIPRRVAAISDTVVQGLSPVAQALVRQACTDADRQRSVADWCGGLGLHRRAVERRCRQRLRMSPERLLLWARALIASVYLEATLLPVLRVAWRVGYEEPSSLSKLLTRLSGHAPRELVQQGGSEYLCACWRGLLTGGEPRRGSGKASSSYAAGS